MLAKIYRPTKTAMQSGKAKMDTWVLELEADAARRIDPLMGWTSSGNTASQVRLSFETREAAIAYAKRQGMPFQVREPREPKRIIKSYSDNFSAGRKRPWTH
ncbi:MAG: ETC complex I subunit [Pseudomonadota bacterium]